MANLSEDTVNLNRSSITAHSVYLVQFICYQVVGLPISLVGILGNIMCVYVWTRKRMQWGVCPTCYYLVGLASSDLLYLLVMNCAVLGPNWRWLENYHIPRIFNDSAESKALRSIGRPLTDVLANISVFYVVAFTAERYVAVTYPICGIVMCTAKRAKRILLIGTLMVIILHIPNSLEDVDVLQGSGYSQNPGYILGYTWGVMVLLFAVAPLLTLIVFNILLIRSVILSRKKRRNMTHKGSRAHDYGHTALTLAIIAIVVVFFLCHAPAAVILCVYTYRMNMDMIEPQSLEYLKWNISFPVVNLLFILNSSINFIIYSALSNKFRRTAMDLLTFSRRPSLREPATKSTCYGTTLRYPPPQSADKAPHARKENLPLLCSSQTGGQLV